MKKSQMVLKPLVAAVAIASGTLVLNANALPTPLPTMAANKVVTETICHADVTTVISAGGSSRSVEATSEFCQVRTLPVTRGLLLEEGAALVGPAEAQTVAPIAGNVHATTAGDKQGSLVLTANNALSVSSSAALVESARNPALDYELVTAVQPATDLTNADLVGNYTIATRSSAWASFAGGIEVSPQAGGVTKATSFYNNFSATVDITFDGEGGCQITDVSDRLNANVRKDPLGAVGIPEYGENCTDPGPASPCAQIDGQNYAMMAAVNVGKYASNPAQTQAEFTQADVIGAACSYTTDGEKVSLTYEQHSGKAVAFDMYLSADKRYLVADTHSAPNIFHATATAMSADPIPSGVALGVRTGAADVAGKTYALNMLQGVSNLSSGTHEAFENQYVPNAQVEQCLSRGQLTFSADGSCQLNTVSACQGRFLSGYEATGVEAEDGSVVDQLGVAQTSAVATVCAWTAAGAKVDMVAEINGQPIDFEFTVADNSEALVGIGGLTVAAVAPDEQNPPVLAAEAQITSNYVIGQQLAAPLSASEFEQFALIQKTKDAAAKGDLNGDGKADLFLINEAGNSQAWVMDGSAMTKRIAYGFNDVNATVAAIHDFDQNGAADVLFMNTQGALSIQLSKANGGADGYASVANYVAGTKVLALVDTDNDGTKEILLQQPNGTLLAVKLNGVVRQSTTNLGQVAVTDTFVGLADLNCDTEADLVFVNSSGSVYSLNLQNGQRVGEAQTFTYNTGAKVVGFTDHNQDGSADVVVLYKKGEVAVLVNDGTGRRTDKVVIGRFGQAAELLSSADINGDGTNDLIVKTADGKLRTLVVGEAAPVELQTLPAGFTFVGEGDLNGDGTVSLVFENKAAMSHHIVELNADGSLKSAVTLNELSRVNSTYIAK